MSSNIASSQVLSVVEERAWEWGYVKSSETYLKWLL